MRLDDCIAMVSTDAKLLFATHCCLLTRMFSSLDSEHASKSKTFDEEERCVGGLADGGQFESKAVVQRRSNNHCELIEKRWTLFNQVFG